MNLDRALLLSYRFVELSKEKRHLFLAGLRDQGVDFSVLPIPGGIAKADHGVLSYAQQRMWFLWQLDPLSAAYNLPMAVRLKGELRQSALQGAFNALVARHESLRCRFKESNGGVFQKVLEPSGVAIHVDDLSALSGNEREVRVAALVEEQALAPFDLANLVSDTEVEDAEQQAIQRSTLREYLKASLPDYMVPAHLLFLEAMPLTPNGKLDRKALPHPDVSELQQAYVAPQSELEQQIAAIWADVLKIERVGLTDNFFELGGHSLLALQIIYLTKEELKISILVESIYLYPVMADFVANILVAVNSCSKCDLEDVERILNGVA